MSFLGIELLRPWALVGVPLALLLLALAFRPERPREIVLGTLRWFGPGVEATRGARGSRRSLPWFALLGGLALCCVSLAASGPRWGSSAPPTLWTVVLDPRPTMGLAHSSGSTRMEVGVERALEQLDELASAGDTVRWVLPDDRTLTLALGEAPGAESLEPCAGAVFRVADYDRPETLLVTDVLTNRAHELSAAGWIAVGAVSVPGLIGIEDGRWLEWDGADVARTNLPVEERVLVLDKRLQGELATLAQLWAGERGFGLVSTAGPRHVALQIECMLADDTRSANLERDGWRGQVQGTPLGALARGEQAWLTSGGETWISAEPGRVRFGFTEIAPRPGADEVHLALSFARLFDRATARPAGAFSLAERLREGPEHSRYPTRSVVAAAPVENDRAVAAWLAGLGAILALAAWSLYAPRSAALSGSD